MALNIVETKDKRSIKLGDMNLSNVLNYSILFKKYTTEVTLVLIFPRDMVNVKVDYFK